MSIAFGNVSTTKKMVQTFIILSPHTGAVAVCCWYASTVEKLRFGSGYECGMFKRSTEPCHVSKIEDSD